MARGELALARRVASRWLLGRELPPEARRPSHLPVALVASLQVGDVVLDLRGRPLRVVSAGPGSVTLQTPKGGMMVFTSGAFRAWSWAYRVAPMLHWLVDR